MMEFGEGRSRLRVAVYSSAWRGGSGWYVQELAKAIATGGAEVMLVSPVAEPLSHEPVHERLRRLYVPQGTGGRGNAIYRAWRAFYKIFVTFLLIAKARFFAKMFIVTMTDWLPITLLQFLWIKLIGGRLVYVVHDVTPHAFAFPERYRELEKRLIHLSYVLPDLVVTLTEMAREEMTVMHGIDQGRVCALPHGAHEYESVGALDGRNVLLVFGMLRRNKRILETIRAMAALPESSSVKLVIAGEPQDRDYWAQCAAEASALGAKIRVEVGFVDEARTRELLLECDGLVLPYEAFNSQSGVAILAAFSERLLICTNSGGIGELIAGGLDPILVERPVSEATIKAALLEFETMPVDERRRKALASRIALLEHLSWARIGGLFVERLQTDARVA